TRLLSEFQKYDLVWVLNSRTANILQLWRWPRAHLDIDDIPSTYARAIAQTGRTIAQRWKAGIHQKLLLRRERLLPARFDTLSVCSIGDRHYLGGNGRVHVIPNGFERPTAEPVWAPAQNPPCIG